MAAYRMVYGDDEQVTRETFDDVEVAREDGWTVLFRGRDAVLRVRDEHVQSIERVADPSGDAAPPAPAGSLTVRDLMRPAATTVEKGAHLAAASYLMRKAGDSALVVLDDSASMMPVALITSRDVAHAIADGQNPEQVRISDLLMRDLITVPPGTGLAEAAELMVSSHIRHLPVVDGSRLVGMLDIGDACRGLLAAR